MKYDTNTMTPTQFILKRTSFHSKKFTDEELVALTGDELSKMELEAKSVDEENCKVFDELKKNFEEARKNFLPFLNGSELKYVQKICMWNPNSHVNHDCFRYSVLDRLKVAMEKKAKIDIENVKTQRIEKAIQYLFNKGKVLGTDFTLVNATEVADEIAFQIEVENLKKSEGYIDFDGQNCDGPCAGWDMESNRCQCGNRRVSFTYGWNHSFETPCVTAEAH